MKNKWGKKIRSFTLVIAATLILTGAFLTGIGLQRMFNNVKIRNEYKNSELIWKNELADGLEEAEARDIRNQALAKNMKYVTIEREIMLDNENSPAEARIANGKESSFSCTVTLLRDATGEIIYESGLLDPGFYIEMINLDGRLKKGYYPCTAVWNFYTEEGEYVGETAWKIVVVIKN